MKMVDSFHNTQLLFTAPTRAISRYFFIFRVNITSYIYIIMIWWSYTLVELRKVGRVTESLIDYYVTRF